MSSIVRVGGSNVDQSADLRGLTTDTKPTRAGGQEVPHGSIWFNMDDSTRYMYNANTDAWYRISDLQITDDTKVSKSSIAPIEDTLVATQAYAIGDEFWISDTLYMVTAPIAQGDGIVIGTNCEVAAKLVTQIKDIKDDLSDLEDTVEDISDTIAPTEATATASQAYAVGEQFFYNNNLMEATSPISQNDAFIVYPTSGYNCKLSESVTGQIADRMTYADNSILGAKNLDIPYNITVENNGLFQRISTGYRIYMSSANTYGRAFLYYKLPKNTAIKLTCNPTYSTGQAQILIKGTNSNWASGVNLASAVTPSSGEAVSINFNTQNYEIVVIRLSASFDVSSQGDISYSNYMLTLADDTNSTFAEPSETNIQLTQNKMSYVDNGILGAKNWLNVNASYSKPASATNLSVTITDNGRVVRITDTDSATYRNIGYTIPIRANTNYVITGNASVTTGDARIKVETTGGTQVGITSTLSGSFSLSFNSGNNTTLKIVLFTSFSTASVSNVTYENLMLRLATDTDPTYQPYAQTNRELTINKTENSVIGNVEDGATASQAYAVGEHFISGGQFKEVTQPIASGGAINSSNTVDKPIADCLIKQATFSGTTSSNGNIEIDATGAKKILYANTTGANFLTFPFEVDGKSYISIKNRSNFTNISETAVSGTYYYID